MPAEMTEKEKRAIEIFQSNRGDHKGNEAWVRHYLYMDRALDAKRLGSRRTLWCSVSLWLFLFQECVVLSASGDRVW